MPIPRSVGACLGTVLCLVLAGCARPERDAVAAGPCAEARADTTGWRRVADLPFPGYSFLLPPGFVEDTTAVCVEGCVTWRSGRRELLVGADYWNERPLRTGGGPPPGFADCRTRIAGMQAVVATMPRQGGYRAQAWFHAPPGFDGGALNAVTLAGSGPAVEDQALFLAVIRSVRREGVDQAEVR